MQDHLWESCGSVVSPYDLCRSLICLHRLSGSSALSSSREDLRCRRLMLVSCHLWGVITWWEQKLSALKIVVLSGRLRTAVLKLEKKHFYWMILASEKPLNWLCRGWVKNLLRESFGSLPVWVQQI
ncbi:uncharacterized protein TNCV_18151 [Trichonephila clavipes]|nr:uncharacterized protein TNCV_18151 [Trichonephila clavipes]